MTTKSTTIDTKPSQRWGVVSKKPLQEASVPYKPHNYQKKAIKFLLEHAAAALFLDPGLGKTSITLAAQKVLKNQGVAKGLLVVAPLRPARTVWTKEVRKWKDFHSLDLVLLHGEGKEQRALEQHDVYVVNYEGLKWMLKPIPKEQGGKSKDDCILKRMFKAGLIDGLVADELSKLKNTDAKMYKALEKWLSWFDRRWGLTGTPAANGYLNLFGQVKVLDLGKAFGPYVTYFRAKYFTPVGDFRWEVTPGAEKVIHERLKPLALRMDAEDYLKMPKYRPVSVYYEIPEDLRPRYEQLEDDLYTQLESGMEIAAVNNGVATNKCRQFASGAVYRQPVDPVTGAPKKRKDNDYEWIHDEKLLAFDELVDELQGQQVLVAYEYQHDLERIAQFYGKRRELLVDGVLPVLGGKTSADRGATLEDMWNSGELPWLFGQPQSMAYGLNLQESSAFNIIFFTLTWDFELYDQLIRRLMRQGNKAPHINVYHMLGRDTVDERVARAIVRKDKVQSQLLDALKDRRQYSADFDAVGNELKNKLLAASKQQKRARAANAARKTKVA